MNEDEKLVISMPGHRDAFHLPKFLDLPSQRRLLELCLRLGEQPAGFYRPVLRNGAKMRVQMMCLGRHWNARSYQYQMRREDVDGLDVQPLDPALACLAQHAASIVGMEINPDIAVVNYYDRSAGLGLHQDKDERPKMIQRGVPVVSISLGDEAVFQFGGLSRRSGTRQIILRSGDAFIFGGNARLCFHGVSRIRPGTAPQELEIAGRYNITLRQY